MVKLCIKFSCQVRVSLLLVKCNPVQPAASAAAGLVGPGNDFGRQTEKNPELDSLRRCPKKLMVFISLANYHAT